MNILAYGKGHSFLLDEETKYFYRYICYNCKIHISQRKDDSSVYGLTVGPYALWPADIWCQTWEELTCEEIIIKNIIE